MRKILNWNKAFYILASLFVVFSPATGMSQGIEVAQVEPVKIRLIVPPGGSKTGTIKVLNLSSEPKKIRAYFEDWYYLPVCDGTKDFKPAGTSETSASRWIDFSPVEFSVPPFGTQTVNYTVNVPEEAKGGHYAVLFFESLLDDSRTNEEGVTVDVAVRVASLFYIEPEGTIKRTARIDDFKVTREKGKFLISAQFVNTGNVDINTKGTFFIIDRKGMVYGRGEFNDVYTFPGDKAMLSASWSEALPKGSYDIVLTIDVGRALVEAKLGKVPAITKEARIEIGDNGEVVSVGELQ